MFTIYKGRNNLYYFSLKAENEERLLNSEGYLNRFACVDGIYAVKSNAIFLCRFEKKATSNGKFYFLLKTANGDVIGTGELYVSESSCDNSIAVIQREVTNAFIGDIS
jgi:uncharacterized protein YegP (UPF0339 family)